MSPVTESKKMTGGGGEEASGGGIAGMANGVVDNARSEIWEHVQAPVPTRETQDPSQRPILQKELRGRFPRSQITIFSLPPSINNDHNNCFILFLLGINLVISLYWLIFWLLIIVTNCLCVVVDVARDKLELKVVNDGSIGYAALEKKAELYDKLVGGEMSGCCGVKIRKQKKPPLTNPIRDWLPIPEKRGESCCEER